MTNAVYPKYKEALLSQATNSSLTAGTVKCALVDTGTYTYSAAHQYYSDLSGVVGTPQTIGSKTVTNGIFDGSDITFPAVSGASVEALVFYIDTGTTTTSRLVCYMDTNVAGFPYTPNGSDFAITWNAAGIFAL